VAVGYLEGDVGAWVLMVVGGSAAGWRCDMGGRVSVWWWMKNVKERVEKVDIHHHFFRQARAAFPAAGRRYYLPHAHKQSIAAHMTGSLEQTHSRHSVL
jgi:hypothetical protein